MSLFYFLISIDGFQINSRSFPFNHAIVDSGNSCLTFPSSFIDPWVSFFQQQNNLHCFFHDEKYAPAYSMMRCKGSIKNYPLINLIIEGKKLTLNPYDYIFYCDYSIEPEETLCYLKLERSTQDPFIIFGDAFL